MRNSSRDEHLRQILIGLLKLSVHLSMLTAEHCSQPQFHLFTLLACATVEIMAINIIAAQTLPKKCAAIG